MGLSPSPRRSSDRQLAPEGKTAATAPYCHIPNKSRRALFSPTIFAPRHFVRILSAEFLDSAVEPRLACLYIHRSLPRIRPCADSPVADFHSFAWSQEGNASETSLTTPPRESVAIGLYCWRDFLGALGLSSLSDLSPLLSRSPCDSPLSGQPPWLVSYFIHSSFPRQT